MGVCYLTECGCARMIGDFNPFFGRNVTSGVNGWIKVWGMESRVVFAGLKVSWSGGEVIEFESPISAGEGEAWGNLI
jgi:hypothetical protein